MPKENNSTPIKSHASVFWPIGAEGGGPIGFARITSPSGAEGGNSAGSSKLEQDLVAIDKPFPGDYLLHTRVSVLLSN